MSATAKKHIAHAEAAAAKGKQGVSRHNWRIVEKFFVLTKAAAPTRSNTKKAAAPDEFHYQDPLPGGFGSMARAFAQTGN
ncbi:MAG: hypothetical protein WCO79_00870 [bacterium]